MMQTFTIHAPRPVISRETMRQMAAVAARSAPVKERKRRKRSQRTTPQPAEHSNQLTTRQLEVLRMMALGLINKQIAEKLGLSQRSVETHRAHLLEKSGCKSSFQLAVWAV
jgi:DNA-binding NarL/FixJ family response regulator